MSCEHDPGFMIAVGVWPLRLADLVSSFDDILRGITSVQNHSGVLHNVLEVVCRVVGRDEDAIL